jgi:hypothetical protein
MEVRRVDWDIVESVAGVARPLRRAAVLVWVRADQEGPRSPAAAVLIISALLWTASENPVCISAWTESEAIDHHGELDN